MKKPIFLLAALTLLLCACQKEPSNVVYNGYIQLKSPGQADNYVSGSILSGALKQGTLFNYHDTVTNYTGVWKVTNRYKILAHGYYYGSEIGYQVQGTAIKGDSTAIVLRVFAESDVKPVK